MYLQITSTLYNLYSEIFSHCNRDLEPFQMFQSVVLCMLMHFECVLFLGTTQGWVLLGRKVRNKDSDLCEVLRGAILPCDYLETSSKHVLEGTH